MAGLTQTQAPSERIFGPKASTNNSKSVPEESTAGSSLRCPECGSPKLWHDGLRYVYNDIIQRWLCRKCGKRFSDPNDLEKSWSHREKLAKAAEADLKSDTA